MSDKPLSPDVKRLGLISFFTDVSSEMLYAITPLFLTMVLGASASVVGVIEGLAEGTASLLKGVSGWYSDRIQNRKRFILLGYGLSALAKPLIALAAAWPLVLVARLLDRFGKGVRGSARDALIADLTPVELRGRAFGLHRALDTAGALTGVALSIILLQTFGDKDQQALRNLYWIAFIPALVGVLLILLVREPVRELASSFRHQTTRDALGNRYWAIVVVAAIGHLGFSSDAFLILKSSHAGLSTMQVLLAYLCYNLCYTLTAYPIGARADKIRKESLLAAGLALYTLVYLGFALITNKWLAFPLFIVYGLFAALTDGVFRALIANVVDKSVRATAIGLFSMITGVVALCASLLAGWLWDAVSPAAPFYVAAFFGAFACIGFIALARQPAPS
ncbi:MAG: MFS transporter [bacterium]|nr:MFS transporter [bacterium]